MSSLNQKTPKKLNSGIQNILGLNLINMEVYSSGETMMTRKKYVQHPGARLPKIPTTMNLVKKTTCLIIVLKIWKNSLVN